MSNHNKISSTAWLVAKFRSLYTDLPFTGEIAREMNKETNPFMMNMIVRAIGYVARRKPLKVIQLAMMESRYLCIEDALPADGEFVLVELASGLSPRGIVHAKAGRMVIESDLPDMLNAKKNLLNIIYKTEKPESHYLLSANVMNPGDFDRLGELYLEKGGGKPLYLVHEGLFLYFTEEEKEIFRNNIAAFLRKYAPGKGYWVTPDFYNVRDNRAAGIIKRGIKMLEKATGKEMSAFETLEEIQSYLKKSDLTGRILPNEHILESLVTLKKLGLSRKELPEIVTRYAACVVETGEQTR